MAAITVKQDGGIMRAFDADTVVAVATRCKGGHDDEWPAGWTVTFSVPTREQALAILRNGGSR